MFTKRMERLIQTTKSLGTKQLEQTFTSARQTCQLGHFRQAVKAAAQVDRVAAQNNNTLL
jgi:hypothetical protein